MAAAIFLARRAAVCVDSSAPRFCGLATTAEGRRQEGRRGMRDNDHTYSGEGAAAFMADTVKEGVKKATEVADAVGEGVKRTVDGAWRAGRDANQEVRETVAVDGGRGTGVNEPEEEEETVVDQVVDEMKKVDGAVDMAEYRAMEQNMEDLKQ